MVTKDERSVLTVAQLNDQAKAVLEQFWVWVRGEVSEFKQARSWVYNYFTLKDEAAQIRCIVRDEVLQKLPAALTDGQALVVFGQVSLYSKRGDYQLKVQAIEAVGQGSLQEQLEKLKRKLQAEGLFAEERKRPLPRFPAKIGVISSKDGAAWKDFKKVLAHRFGGGELILRDVLVQGEKSPIQIVEALQAFNAEREVDLIVLTRGGGSLEDLWGFNDERVARAIVGSAIPIVSAVGHEKDVTIADLVADHRSSTPSNAAEEIVPHRDELARQLDEFAFKITQVKNRWKELPREIDLIWEQVQLGFARFIRERVQNLDLVYRKVLALSPEAVLSRGYGIVYRKDNVISRAGQVKIGELLKIRLAEGGLFTEVKGKSKK